MVRKSYGKMKGTRFKLNSRGKLAINKFLAVFNIGDRVHIDFSSHQGIPHPKFQGRTGIVLSKRGRGYEVLVSDMDAKKKVCMRPEHIKKVI